MDWPCALGVDDRCDVRSCRAVDSTNAAVIMLPRAATPSLATTPDSSTTLLAPATPVHDAQSTLSTVEETLARKLVRRFRANKEGQQRANGGATTTPLLKQVFVSCGMMADGRALDADERRMVGRREE